MVVYGLKKGQALYGNPNVGNATEAEIRDLSAGQTYFFAVRAVNGCVASGYSNEVAARAPGALLSKNAENFSARVLSAQKSEPQQQVSQSAGKDENKPGAPEKRPADWFDLVIRFLLSLNPFARR